MNQPKIKNIAIIAHVDHGKTTLVDALLRQSKTKLGKDMVDQTCIMDSNDLEKERGITIFSKNASVVWKDTKINIIDTPGHVDFGGEVERVLKMAEGSLLLVDAKEGPMPQTRFVLKKALELGHKIIVIINKMDTADRRPDYALNKTFDLFIELGAGEETAFFPVVYAAGREGKAGLTQDLSKMHDISPIFDAIIKYIPCPIGDIEKPLQMLVTSIGHDNHKGRTAIAKIYNGRVLANQEVMHINRNGEKEKSRLTSLSTFEGLTSVDVLQALAGDIVKFSGIADINIGETIADPLDFQALPLLNIEEPTVKMEFRVNDSPFAGTEGQFQTSRQVKERLYKELQSDMALKVEDGDKNDWIVSGRGELHLAILIERMRREGYEFQVARPQVIVKKVDGVDFAPFERVFIEVPSEFQGVVMQKMGLRHAILEDLRIDKEIVFLEFSIATRELLGFRNEFLTDTKGMGIINSAFLEYRKDSGIYHQRNWGSLVATESGITNMFGLLIAQGRGTLFVGPGIPVYKGQVAGQNSREKDIGVNICKTKELTNMRSKGEGENEHFNTPRVLSLENALEYIDDEELVEITPKNIRIRKVVLDEVAERRKVALGRKG